MPVIGDFTFSKLVSIYVVMGFEPWDILLSDWFVLVSQILACMQYMALCSRSLAKQMCFAQSKHFNFLIIPFYKENSMAVQSYLIMYHWKQVCTIIECYRHNFLPAQAVCVISSNRCHTRWVWPTRFVLCSLQWKDCWRFQQRQTWWKL